MKSPGVGPLSVCRPESCGYSSVRFKRLAIFGETVIVTEPLISRFRYETELIGQ